MIIKRFIAPVALLSALAMPCAAETIQFETDEDIMVLRGRDDFGHATFELLSEAQTDDMMQCVAIDPNGKPLAVSVTMGAMASVTFLDLDVSSIDRVACKFQ